MNSTQFSKQNAITKSMKTLELKRMNNTLRRRRRRRTQSDGIVLMLSFQFMLILFLDGATSKPCLPRIGSKFPKMDLYS